MCTSIVRPTLKSGRLLQRPVREIIALYRKGEARWTSCISNVSRKNDSEAVRLSEILSHSIGANYLQSLVDD